MSKQAVVGILAHVDAGKTTLAEAMLFNAGRIRKRGRVDDGDSHLDTNAIERERGITIFSSQAVLDYGDTHVMLVDAPVTWIFRPRRSARCARSTTRFWW